MDTWIFEVVSWLYVVVFVSENNFHNSANIWMIKKELSIICKSIHHKTFHCQYKLFKLQASSFEKDSGLRFNIYIDSCIVLCASHVLFVSLAFLFVAWCIWLFLSFSVASICFFHTCFFFFFFTLVLVYLFVCLFLDLFLCCICLFVCLLHCIFLCHRLFFLMEGGTKQACKPQNYASWNYDRPTHRGKV